MNDAATTAPPIPPFIVAEGWDVSFYSSEDALNRHIEPWYPSDVEYRAFDSQGRKLKLAVERETIRRRWLWDTTRERIIVRAIEHEPGHAQEIAELLAEWLPMTGAAKPAPAAPLGELLRAAIERTGLDHP